MRAPGREYEEAVYAFAKTLDPQSEVLLDHDVADRDTGELRQCDVWINAKVGGHWPLSILVSCKDHKRKLHAGDIGAFRDEVRSMGANMGVIYSRAGFTRPALAKAEANSISWCRIYSNEPADLPLTIWFDQFVCEPSVKLVLETDLRDSQVGTWNDLFDVAAETDGGGKTLLDVAAEAFAQGEEWSLSEGRKSSHDTSNPCPPDWSTKVHVEVIEIDGGIEINVLGHWRAYRARAEATLLNGSYCLSNGSYRGGLTGPWIDLRSAHPGEGWTEMVDADTNIPSNRVTLALLQGDVKKPLRAELGSRPLY